MPSAPPQPRRARHHCATFTTPSTSKCSLGQSFHRTVENGDFFLNHKCEIALLNRETKAQNQILFRKATLRQTRKIIWSKHQQICVQFPRGTRNSDHTRCSTHTKKAPKKWNVDLRWRSTRVETAQQWLQTERGHDTLSMCPLEVQKKLVYGNLKPCHANLILDIPTRHIQLCTQHTEGTHLARRHFSVKMMNTQGVTDTSEKMI